MPDYDDNATEDPKEKLRSLAERIQVGDTDEGAEAIQEMIGMVRDQGVARENVRAALRDELNDARLKSENQKALATFERKYPNVAKDGVLAEAAAHVIRDEIVEDLRAGGATTRTSRRSRATPAGSSRCTARRGSPAPRSEPPSRSSTRPAARSSANSTSSRLCAILRNM
jgi:hypothetical protein